ncbi:MAG: EamA family transporter [Pseudomonadota bacterium]
MKTSIYTVLALFCFAANSVLCRLALGEESIDPVSFTIVRLTSGIVTLAIILALTRTKRMDRASTGSWISAAALFIYAITFSLAYVSLDTGTGALMLFGCVQISIIVWQIFNGKRLSTIELVGLLLAFSGLIYLVYPSIQTPSLLGLILMGIAGFA